MYSVGTVSPVLPEDKVLLLRGDKERTVKRACGVAQVVAQGPLRLSTRVI